jgi:hypothetical protein
MLFIYSYNIVFAIEYKTQAQLDIMFFLLAFNLGEPILDGFSSVFNK